MRSLVLQAWLNRAVVLEVHLKLNFQSHKFQVISRISGTWSCFRQQKMGKQARKQPTSWPTNPPIRESTSPWIPSSIPHGLPCKFLVVPNVSYLQGERTQAHCFSYTFSRWIWWIALPSVSVPGSIAFRSSNACSLRGVQLTTKGVAKAVKAHGESCESHRVIERQKQTAWTRVWSRRNMIIYQNHVPIQADAMHFSGLSWVNCAALLARSPIFRQGGCWRGQWQSRLAVKLISRICPGSDRSNITNPFRSSKQNEAVALTGTDRSAENPTQGECLETWSSWGCFIGSVQDGSTESRNSIAVFVALVFCHALVRSA